MEDKIVKKHIDVIVENTFKTIIEVYRTQKENQKIVTNNNSSRIIFPLKRESKDNKEEFRISEQELRFVFVEEFNKYCSENWDAYYSVETPTSKRYDFSNKENPCKVDYSNGQSAMVDFSIFLKEQDKLTRVALIEFKALNPDKQSYMKDYVKLLNEDQKFVYFIMIVKSANDRTIKSIAEKIKASYDNAGLDTEKKVEFRCLDLGTGKEI
ncbi:hypothetical protein [Segatella copri]|uniref:hypothetical protein n=1 Tax=Segatella copri TaxID=165179 RepID=UPI00294B8A89|nr:hypothetical protein [Segatella copri]WOF89055.1 hypothetical protein RJT05_06905 [Segatella copri]WOF95200.1 hypothetical protein RJT10_07040 [Segatella copri]